MKRTVLLAAVLVLSAAGLSFAQAAAESALTHALSSGAGTSLGTALGRATGQLAGRVGQQTSAVASQKLITVKPGAPGAKTQRTPMTATQAGSTGSMIASIEGGENQPTCAASVKTAEPKAAEAKSPAQPTSAPQNCVNTQTQADSHPSVINLPAPK